MKSQRPQRTFLDLNPMGLFEYPITRSFRFSRFQKSVVYLFMLCWTIVVTVINVAAVGYELVPTSSPFFATTYHLWYEKFRPKIGTVPILQWPSRTCDPSIIKLGEGYPN